MPDLYEILGVTRDATTEEIRAAYRRRVKTAHPDAGGDAEEFRALADAEAVLTDERRRRLYDETGRTSDEPDPVLVRANVYLAQALNVAIESAGIDPQSVNIVDRMSFALSDGFDQISREILALSNEISKFERVVRRFKTTSAVDPVGDLMRAKIEKKKTVLAQARTDLDAVAKALSILSSYTFTPEARITGFEYEEPSSFRTWSIKVSP